MMAAAAEDFTARFFGVVWIPRTDRPDEGWDLVLRDGRRVDVKWSDKEFAQLVCSPEANSRAEVFVGVVGNDLNDFVITGWATREELFNSLVDLGHGPVYALSQAELHPIDEL